MQILPCFTSRKESLCLIKLVLPPAPTPCLSLIHIFYPTGRFYHTLRYFRTVFSVSACDLPQDAEENKMCIRDRIIALQKYENEAQLAKELIRGFWLAHGDYVITDEEAAENLAAWTDKGLSLIHI